MELTEAIKARRSIRLFKQKTVSDGLLMDLVSVATLAPSAGNALPLRYVVIRTPELVKRVFELTAWAAHVKPHRNPVWGVSAPSAFIAVCATGGSDNPLIYTDAGAAIQNMLLRAVDLGLGCCWLGAFNKDQLNGVLELKGISSVYLLAVGYPDEAPVQDNIWHGDSTKYHLDANGVLHVPKYDPESITAMK